MMRYTVVFVHQTTGERRQVLVDPTTLSRAELVDIWDLSGGVGGPLAKVHAYRRAMRDMPPEFLGETGSVALVRVHDDRRQSTQASP